MSEQTTPFSELTYSMDKSGAAKYSTYAEFRVFNQDLFIYFYQTAIEGTEAKPILCHYLVERIAMPIEQIKGFATGLANVVATIEADQKIVLPNNRTASPSDKIKIW